MAGLTYTIFYSWQSDLPNSTTRGLIESSIEAAARKLKNTATVLADRDTQGLTGAPDIVETIFSKIDQCDVFVADVTSVATYRPMDTNGNFIDRVKATPNANVMIELGYATQVVGWDNIICIMNDDYNKGGDIPFDIEHHRLTHFSLEKKAKADVRKELRDIIVNTVMNVMKNGKRVRPQFSNISIGSWNSENNSVVKGLIPYNVCTSGAVQARYRALCDTARILFEEIQSAKIRKQEELPVIEEKKVEEDSAPQKKFTMHDGTEIIVPSISYNDWEKLIDFNNWCPVDIAESEKIETANNIKKYFEIEIGPEFFDFGGLRRKKNLIPGYADNYDGTDEEVKKYDDYIEFGYTIGLIQMLETYIKTFNGLILLPLAAKNESSVSDSDIHISIQVDNSTAEVVCPSSALICDELSEIAGLVYQEGLVELTLEQDNTAEIRVAKDDRFWSVEDNQIEMQARVRGGINGQPFYGMDDYVRELSRYIAAPEDDDSTVFSFDIPSLHAKEAKWLSHTIVLRPLKKTVQLKYNVKSARSDGSLEGILELTL